jgi:hypothetical protein
VTKPDTKWTAVAPGVMELPTTKFQITYIAGSLVPFRVTWDSTPIPNGTKRTLAEAQAAAEAHMAELITMGFEV